MRRRLESLGEGDSPSVFFVSYNSSSVGGANITSLMIGGGFPAGSPLLTLYSYDDLGQVVTSDNATICTVSTINNATGYSIPLGYANTYFSVNGATAIFPFKLSAAPGTEGLVYVTCVNGAKQQFPPLIYPIATVPVLVTFSPASLSQKWFALPSNPSALFPVGPIEVFLTDASGNAVLQSGVRCSVAIESSTDLLTGLAVGGTILGSPSSYAVAGVATFSVSLQASGNVSNVLTASCIWLTGDIVYSRTRVTITTVPFETAWTYGPYALCTPLPLTPE